MKVVSKRMQYGFIEIFDDADIEHYSRVFFKKKGVKFLDRIKFEWYAPVCCRLHMHEDDMVVFNLLVNTTELIEYIQYLDWDAYLSTK